MPGSGPARLLCFGKTAPVAAWNWGMKYMNPILPRPNPFLVEKMA
jgi:hypothetical protein